MNNVVLIGRLTKDPDLRYLQSGMAVSRFSLAVDKDLSKEKKQEMEANNQPTADFINIVVWGKQAENCANYLAKGRLVAIQGRIQTRNYEKDGNRVYITEVVAERTEFLEWGDKNNSNENGNSRPPKSQSQQNNNFDDFGDFGGFGNFVDDDDIPF